MSAGFDYSEYFTLPAYTHGFWSLAFGRGYINFAADVHNHPKNKPRERFVDREAIDSAWIQTLDELFQYWDGGKFSESEMQTKLAAAKSTGVLSLTLLLYVCKFVSGLERACREVLEA
jgi:hypothetical protein